MVCPSVYDGAEMKVSMVLHFTFSRKYGYVTGEEERTEEKREFFYRRQQKSEEDHFYRVEQINTFFQLYGGR